MHRKKKQNLEARTAEMEQRALKEMTNLVEISQMVDLHRLLLEHRVWCSLIQLST